MRVISCTGNKVQSCRISAGGRYSSYESAPCAWLDCCINQGTSGNPPCSSWDDERLNCTTEDSKLKESHSERPNSEGTNAKKMKFPDL